MRRESLTGRMQELRVIAGSCSVAEEGRGSMSESCVAMTS